MLAQFVIEHLDKRKLVVKSDPNAIYRPGDFKSIKVSPGLLQQSVRAEVMRAF